MRYELVLDVLYIPIWFYSNKYPQTILSTTGTFTFQSGSIQIFLASKNDESFSRFTFQSGSIQMLSTNLICKPLIFFTFQSGSIQIERRLHKLY